MDDIVNAGLQICATGIIPTQLATRPVTVGNPAIHALNLCKKNIAAICVFEVAQQSLLGIQQCECISTAYDVKYWAD